MQYEKRVIIASALAGLTDIIVGLFMFFTGWHQWYFEHFHFFGMIGVSMLAYSFWHFVLYYHEDIQQWMRTNLKKS